MSPARENSPELIRFSFPSDLRLKVYVFRYGGTMVPQLLRKKKKNFKYFFSLLFIFLFQAVVRFGSVSAPLERGEVVPGTYCSRNFYECYRKRCRLQSPNYPGMYPRNVTCYLSLRQKEVPTCKHAMIVVKQENSHKMQIKVRGNIFSCIMCKIRIVITLRITLNFLTYVFSLYQLEN